MGDRTRMRGDMSTANLLTVGALPAQSEEEIARSGLPGIDDGARKRAPGRATAGYQ